MVAGVALKLHSNVDLAELGATAPEIGFLPNLKLDLPDVDFDFILDASATIDLTKTEKSEKIKKGLDGLQFDNVTLDLDSLEKFVELIVNVVGGTLGPVFDLLGTAANDSNSLLNTKLPVLKDIPGINRETLRDFTGDSANQFFEAASTIVNYGSLLNNLLRQYDGQDLDFGCFSFDSEAKTILPCEVSEFIASAKSVSAQTFLAAYQQISQASGSLQLDFLNPENFVNLLIGNDADLVSLAVPEVSLELGRGIAFDADVLTVEGGASGDVELEDLAFVYDTVGLRKIVDAIADGDEPDWEDLLAGFYFRNRPGPELSIELDVSAKGSLDIEVFEGSASLKLSGDVQLDILDDDGKLRLDEINETTDGELANLLCLFDAHASLSGSVDVDARVGISPADFEISADDLGFDPEIDFDWNFSRIFGSKPACFTEPDPILAGPDIVVEDGAPIHILRLHTGPYADCRLFGDVSDEIGSASLTVKRDGGQLLVSGFGVEDQAYPLGNVKRIVGIGGPNGDRFNLTRFTASAGDGPIPVHIDGGDGDDDIDGGDVLIGGNGDDFIDPGAGDDRVITGGGENVVSGSDGADSVDASENEAPFSYTGPNEGDTVIGAFAFSNTLEGTHLTGGNKNDNLTADGTLASTLIGMGGNDTLTVRQGAIGVDSGPGDDSVILDLTSQDSLSIVTVRANAVEVGSLTPTSLTAVESIEVNLEDKVDTVSIIGATADVTINTFGGNDVVTVRSASGDVMIDTGGDTDEVIIERRSVIAPMVGSLGNGTVGGFGLGAVTYVGEQLEKLTLNLGSGDDTITITDTSAATQTIVNAGAGDDQATIDSVSGQTSFNGGVGEDVAELLVNENASAIPNSFPDDLGFDVEKLIIDSTENTSQPEWRLQDRFVSAKFSDWVPVANAIGAQTVEFKTADGSAGVLTVQDTVPVDKTIRIDRQTIEIEQGIDVLQSGSADQALSETYVPAASLTAPYDVAFDKDRKHAYVLDSGAIRAFEIDSRDPDKFYYLGAVTVSGLPAIGSGDLSVSDDGKFVYAVNRNSPSLFQFKRNTATGELSGLTATPVRPEPQSVYVSPNSKYVYLLHGGSLGIVASFEVTSDGTLKPAGDIFSTFLSDDGLPWQFKDWAFHDDGTIAYINGTRAGNNETFVRIAKMTISATDGSITFGGDILNEPTGLLRDGVIAIGPDGSIYVADQNQRKLQRHFLSDAGERAATLIVDIPGDKLSETNSEIVFENNRVYLTVDSGPDRILLSMPIPGSTPDGTPDELVVGTAGEGRIAAIPGTNLLLVPTRETGKIEVVDIAAFNSLSRKTIENGTTEIRSIPSLNALTFSPNGNDAYGLASEGDALIKFSIGSDGVLTQQSALWGSAFGSIGRRSATDIVADDTDIYVASPSEGKVSVLEKSGSTVVAETTVDVVGARVLALQGVKPKFNPPSIRPGKLYVGGSNSVTVFDRDKFGSLSNEKSFSVDGTVVDLTIDPLRDLVYAATSSRVYVLKLNASGDLEQLQEVIDPTGALTNISLSAFRDQLYVGHAIGLLYVAPIGGDGRIGETTQTIQNGRQGVIGIPTVDAVVTSGDGQFVFVGSGDGKTILTFLRENGNLKLVERSTEGSAGFDGLAGLNDLILGPGGRIYASSRDSSGTVESGGWAFFNVNIPDDLDPDSYRVRWDNFFDTLNVKSGAEDDPTAGGADHVSILSSWTQTTTVQTFGGNDRVSHWTASSGSTTTIELGEGNDRLTVDGNGLTADVSEVGASGQADTDILEFLGDVSSLLGTFNTDGTLTMPSGNVKVDGKGQLNYDTFEGSNLQIEASFDIDDITLEEGGDAVLSDPIPSTLTYDSVSWDLDGDGFFLDETTSGLDLSWSELNAFGIDDDGTYPIAMEIITPNLRIVETVAIVVSNKAPTLTASIAAIADRGVPVQLTLGSQGDSGNDTIFEWTVDWGDSTGVMTYSSDNPVVEHIYEDVAASQTITIEAEGEDGQYGPITRTVEVVAGEPRVRKLMGTSTIDEGEEIAFSLVQSGGSTSAEKWSVNFGDGKVTPFTDITDVTHRYADDGVYNVSAVLLESDGSYLPTTMDFVVTVRNVEPGLVVDGISEVDEGSLYTLDLSASDPGNDVLSQWMIDWGDGSSSSIAGSSNASTHVYSDDSAGQIGGQFTISIPAAPT